MATIPINPIDMSGLSSIAGKSVGNLNFPITAPDPSAFTEPLFEAAKTRAAIMASLLQTKMQGQNQMDVNKLIGENQLQYGEQQNQAAMDRTQVLAAQRAQEMEAEQAYRQATLGLSRDQLAQQGLFQQGQLANDQARLGMDAYKTQLESGFREQEVDIKRKQMMQEGVINELKAKQLLGAESLNRRGAYATTALMSLQENGPKAAWARVEQARKDGIISEAEYTALEPHKNDAVKLKDAFRYDIMTTAYAQGSNKGMSEGIGMSVGGALTKGGQAEVEKNLVQTESIANTAQNLVNTVRQNASALTNAGAAQSIAGHVYDRNESLVPMAEKTMPGFLKPSQTGASEAAITAINQQRMELIASYSKKYGSRTGTKFAENFPEATSGDFSDFLVSSMVAKETAKQEMELSKRYLVNGAVPPEKQQEFEEEIDGVFSKENIEKNKASVTKMFTTTFKLKDGTTITPSDFMEIVKKNPGVDVEYLYNDFMSNSE